MGQSIRVFIADADPNQRIAFRAVFEFSEDITIVGEAMEATATLAQVRTLQPDVLVLNPLLPKRKAHVLLRELQQQVPKTRILLLAAEWRDCLHNATPLQGVAGYLLCSAPREELRMAIRILYHGGEVKPFALMRSTPNDFSRFAMPGWLAIFLGKVTQGRFGAPLRERLLGRSLIAR